MGNTSKLDDLKWQSLVNSIRDGRCVLFIGPLLATMRQVYADTKGLEEGNTQKQEQRHIVPVDSTSGLQPWSPIYTQLALHLAKHLQEKQISYDREYQTDLEYIAQRYLEIDRRMTESDLKLEADRFLRDNAREIPPVYRQIAGLPTRFSLVINTSPDKFLDQAFGTNAPHQFKWYNYEDSENSEVVQFSPANPLIYNLVGSLGVPKSLVLTEAQQLTFIKKIIQDSPKIPEKVVNKLGENQKETIYLFLGFNFDRWQFRMLLDRLNLTNDSNTYAPSHPLLPLEQRTAEFYVSRFGFFFVEDQVEIFLSELQQWLQQQSPTRPAPGSGDHAQADAIPQLYLSFHEDDWETVKGLEKWLLKLQEDRLVNIWHRRMASAGEIGQQIKDQWDASRFVIPLVSVNYLMDKLDIEQQKEVALMSLNPNKQIIPILISYSPFENTRYDVMTMLPRNRKPMNDPSWGALDYVQNIVYTELRDILKSSI